MKLKASPDFVYSFYMYRQGFFILLAGTLEHSLKLWYVLIVACTERRDLYNSLEGKFNMNAVTVQIPNIQYYIWTNRSLEAKLLVWFIPFRVNKHKFIRES